MIRKTIRQIRKELGIPSQAKLMKAIGLPSVNDVKKALGIKYKSKVLKSVNILKVLGYKVSYRKRTDGGYLITKINGKRYKGAKGNAIARILTNERISTQAVQANRKNVLKAIPKLRKDIANYSGRKLFTKVQSALREAVKLGEQYEVTRQGKKITYNRVHGKITYKKYQELVAKEGIKKAEEALRNLWSKVNKLAYKESVGRLVSDINYALKKEKITNPNTLEKANKIKEYLSTHNITEAQRQEALSLMPGDSLTDPDNQAWYDSMKSNENVWDSVLDGIIDILGI